MVNPLDWTSDHVFVVVLALITVAFVCAGIRQHLETQRFIRALEDPDSELRQALREMVNQPGHHDD